MFKYGGVIVLSLMLQCGVSFAQTPSFIIPKKFTVALSANNAAPKNRRFATSLSEASLPATGLVPHPTYGMPTYRAFKISKQVVLGQISGAALAFGFVAAQAAFIPESNLSVPLVMYSGYLTGMVLGVHFTGNDRYEHAALGRTVLGAALGLPVGYLIYKSDPKPHGFSALAPFVFPTLGAVISFNLSAKPKTKISAN